MCFSPEADLIAGAVIGAVSIDVLLHHPTRRDWALASLPPLLAAHSLIESLVWFGARGQVSEAVGTAATYAYLLIAFVVLPTLVPVAVLLRESDPRRRRWLTGLTGAGVVVSLGLLWSLLDGPVGTTLLPHAISYDVGVVAPWLLVPLYVVATCGAGLLSSHRHIFLFGAVNLVAVLLLGWRATAGLASLWCIWAAVTSLAIALLVRCDERERRAGATQRPDDGTLGSHVGTHT